MFRFDLRTWGFFVVGLGLLLGCNAGSDSLDTIAVSGVVTLKGSPVEGASVTFVPAGSGQSAVGLTDSAGKYALTTLTSGDGALPGQYKVIVTKYEGATDAGGGSTAAPLPNGDMPDSYGGAAPDAEPAKNLLPAKYASPDTSGLAAEVKAGSPSTHDFALEE